MTLFQSGDRFQTRHFFVRWQKTTNPHSRIGFAFSRNLGTAILRNRFKRRWRALLQTTPTLTNLDMVVVSKTPLHQISNQDWKNEKLRVANFLKEPKASPKK